ncbi:LamG-like jellyroll fold domain-containing protein [Nocardia terpenica]|uniref:LamG-like jellyroll fold domain-containing protein n=1 Tax=Nocardia terpenica TaxID=455432 RepID=A0A291RIP9_9NOCA|nr:LamG-like jellyroll fold domain-containing protein [Nocardia terpenica]ATL67473.1 hypothetical protein CRH09_15960 [Nocardia terpenica]
MTAPYPAAVDRMAGNLTVPFAAGADRLPLRYRGESSAHAAFADYDFAEHLARFGTDPRPRYIVTALEDIPGDTVVTVGYSTPQSATATVTFTVPGGTIAGTSLMVPLGADAAKAVLKTVAVQGPKGQQPPVAAGSFGFTALLGDLAALLWVLGGDRDLLAGHYGRVRAQHTVEQATGLSLDLLGSDLSIPRFPPLPYGFAADTIALYHCEDTSDTVTVADAMTLYTGAGHPGTRLPNTMTGADGRFGAGLGFVFGQSEVTVPDHADFALPVTASLTAECFVRPAAVGGRGAFLSKHTDMLDPAKPGWGLHLGNFRGLDRDVRLLVSDGTTRVELFADLSLDTDRFHHIAAVLDRVRGVTRLYVNGELRASDSTALGALTNAAPLRIGFNDTTGGGFSGSFFGTLDEIRISRAALTSFGPVLGEDDESYRSRLMLFRRWNLPTPTAIADALNGIVGLIDGVLDPITVSDAYEKSPVGSHTVTVRPAILQPGESIDALGRRGIDEAEVCGTLADDPFDPRWLTYYSGPAANFPVGDPRMRQPLTRALDALHAVLVELEGHSEPLWVSGGYDPKAPDLRAVGRALIVWHPFVPAARLAALAHRAGFSWVRHRAATDDVYLSIADTSVVEITGGTGWFGTDLGAGNPTTPLGIQPLPPREAQQRWSLLQAGPGRAELLGTVVGNVTNIHPLAPGEVTVALEIRLGGRTYSAARRFTIGPQTLAANHSIGADGTQGVDESIAGSPGDGAYAADYLVTVTDPLLKVAVPGSNRMQADVADRLGRLLAIAGKPITLASGWTPTGTGLDAVGRALTLMPGDASITLPTLGVMAHGAGFDYVENTGTAIRVAQRAGEHLKILGPRDVEEGSATAFSLSPQASPAGGRRVEWSVVAADDAAARLDGSTGETTTLLADRAGAIQVRARAPITDGGNPPYTVRVGLAQQLIDREKAGTKVVIRRDQYERIMNVLNELHPIGVEFDTTVIRAHVLELAVGQLDSFPAYTYPTYRLRGQHRTRPDRLD